MFLVLWTFLAAIMAAWANSRGRNGAGFFLISFFGSPLLALIILLVTKDLAAESEKEKQRLLDEAKANEERAREHEKQLESIRALRSEPAASAHAGRPSAVDELERLAALLEKGLLTEQEFQAQKAAVLSRS